MTHNDIHDLARRLHLLLGTGCEYFPGGGGRGLVGLLLWGWSGLNLGDPTCPLYHCVEGLVDHVRLLPRATAAESSIQ